jgi:hypothetical protein
MGCISIPTVLAIAGTAASVAGTAVAVEGAQQQAQAQKNAANFNAQVAQQNQQTANQNAAWASQAGEEKAAQSELATRARQGAIKAGIAAGGVDVNSGSAASTEQSAAELGELDAINIRADAARTAYGYVTQSTSFADQANLDTATGQNAETAGNVSSATTALGGLGSASSNFGKFLSQNSTLIGPEVEYTQPIGPGLAGSP